MNGFIDTVLGFPTVLFTPLLLVVVAYWVVVAAGGTDPDVSLPVSVPVSLFAAFGWFASLAAAQFLPGWLALIAALAVAALATRLGIVLFRRFHPAGAESSRNDFVGLTCVIRTGRVSATFGQAEVHARDGSSAIVQVRQAGADELTAGTVALLYDFDPEGEFFWVVPADIATKED